MALPEYLGEALAAAREYDLTIEGIHTHIGSGSDPEVWKRVALISLDICARIPDATALSLGGGYKVGRVKGEETTDLHKIGLHVKEAFRSFEAKHGRKLRLEVEPGTYLVANACALIATAIDVVDTLGRTDAHPGRRGIVMASSLLSVKSEVARIL